MKNNCYKYIFGPVPSRRFGRSLGIDLIPYKTCSLDCIFCQLGRTTDKTVVRKEYVPIEAVLTEIKNWLQADGDADYITLSGSGEPTLHSRFGEVLKFLQDSPIPSALLTNGTMLHLPEVRVAASYADVVKVSLSAWDQQSFWWVNRPCPELTFDRFIEGQKNFRSLYKGELWLEVFLMLGINSMPKDIKKIAAFAKTIQPDRIQLNTVVRPPAEDFAVALSRDRLETLSQLFDPPAEITAEFSTDHAKDILTTENDIFSMLQRRPCTIEDIDQAFGLHINEASKYLGKLMRTHHVRSHYINTSVYYSAVVKQDTGKVSLST